MTERARTKTARLHPTDRAGTTYWRLEAAARVVRLTTASVHGYVESGTIQPTRVEGDATLFGERELARLRKIRRLQRDLGINRAGVEVVMRLLDEIELLRARDADSEGPSPSTRGDPRWR